MASRSLYPFVDLPFHLTAGTIIRQVDAGQGPLAEHYTYDLTLQPNIVHLLFVSSPILPSVESANRLYYALYALLLPLSTLFLIRRLGGDPALSLLSFLLLYNFNVHWGFAGYTLAIPLVLLFLGLLVTETQAGDPRRRLLLSLLLIVIFWTHALAALFTSLLVILFAGASWWRDRRLGWWWVPLPMWALLIAWRWASDNPPGTDVISGVWRDYPSLLFSQASIWARSKAMFQENLHLWPQGWRFPLTIGFSLAMMAPLIAGWRRLRDLVQRPAGRAGGLFLLAGVGCVALLPSGLSGQWAIYQRFPVFALLAVIVVGSLLTRRWSTIMRVGTVSLLALHAALYTDYFNDFERQQRFLRPDLFANIAPEARLGAVIYDSEFRDQSVYIHFADYYSVWHGGLSTSAVARFRFGVMRPRPGAPEMPQPALWLERNAAYDGRYSDLDVLLVRGHVPLVDQQYFADFEIVEAESPWTLYRRQSNEEKGPLPSPPG